MTSKSKGRAAQAELLTARETTLWHAVKALGEKALLVVGAEIEAHTGLSGADFGVLSRLEDLGSGSLGQRELSLSLGWHKSRLSHHLTRMEARQLIRRSPDKTSRGVSIAIEPSGKKAIAAARPVHAATIRAHILQFIGIEEEAVLLRLAAHFKVMGPQ
jgi:DNA-binding MarR family transcriptional regulator